MNCRKWTLDDRRRPSRGMENRRNFVSPKTMDHRVLLNSTIAIETRVKSERKTISAAMLTRLSHLKRIAPTKEFVLAADIGLKIQRIEHYDAYFCNSVLVRNIFGPSSQAVLELAVSTRLSMSRRTTMQLRGKMSAKCPGSFIQRDHLALL